jgi:hypothetical protein
MNVEFDSKTYQKVRLNATGRLHVVSLQDNPDFFSFKDEDEVDIYFISESGYIAYEKLLRHMKRELKIEGALVTR